MNAALRFSSRLCARSCIIRPSMPQSMFARLHQRLSTLREGDGHAPKTTPSESSPGLSEPSPKLSESDVSKSFLNSDKDVPPSISERVKLFFKRYGRMGLVVYFSISAFTFSSIYALISMGVDMKGYLDRWGIQLPQWSEKASGAMVAYLFYKLLLPVRLSLAMLLTPSLTKYWHRIRK